jgi:uncharacterized protein with HEPN domain
VKESWRPHAQHVLDAIAKIRRIEAKGGLNRDDILYDAALRNLQTSSESPQHIPDSLKAAFRGSPWRDLSGFRNILVHSYLGEIDALTVQRRIKGHLPELDPAFCRCSPTIPRVLATDMSELFGSAARAADFCTERGAHFLVEIAPEAATGLNSFSG